MPIPDLNENGLLPEGVHDCTLDEIGARFGRFRRYRLDVFVVKANSPEYEKWIDLFRQVKFPPPERKGILRITL